MRKSRSKAFTLVEVLAATLILSGSVVTVILYSADNLAMSTEIEQRVTSTVLAENEMEKIKNTLRRSFDTDFTAWSSSLGGNYFAVRTSTDVSSTLKKVAVSVGFDGNSNGLLDAAEVVATVTTQVVERN